MEFPLKSFDIKLPKWMQVLPSSSEVISSIIDTVKEVALVTDKMKDFSLVKDALLNIDGVKRINETDVKLGEGRVVYEIEPKGELFYKLLSELSGDNISGEFELMSYVKELNVAKENYRKLKQALSQVDENGYGIVIPSESEMTLSESEVVKRGGLCGVKLKANTSCMHLIKINLDAEVSPISGTEKQCNDFAEFIKSEYQENPSKVWNTDVFGKPLSSLVSDEIVGKISGMKDGVKTKMRKTVTKIVNEGKSSVICIVI
jgi:stage IV sporulation protein A